MLKGLPETLDETYERILRDINKANRDHAHRLLQCLTIAVRPLRVAELAEVLAVDFGTVHRGGTSKLNTDWRWEDQQEAVLSTCSSLISVVNENSSQIVQFSHFSVKEFLTSSRIAGSSADVSRFHILLEPAHTIVAKACLGVLMRSGELVDEDNVKGNVEDKFPLVRYAAEHWVDHARFENVPSHIREGMEQLFDPDKPYFDAWLRVYDIDTEPSPDSVLFYFAKLDKPKTGTPLYYAALCGFHDLAEQLIIKYPHQVNTASGRYVSPLGAALSGGHLKTAQLLYEHGAEVDVQGLGNCTLLRGASSWGHPAHLEIVRWLLSRGANLTVPDKQYGWTPLHAAALSGQVEISRSLLQYKADDNAQDLYGKTPLHKASEMGRVNVARLLLEHGAEVNARDNSRNTPLHYASRLRHREVVRLLVEHGGKIDAENDKGRTVSRVASDEGHHDIAKLPSDHDSK
jgi:ankyrin repeat protein